MIRIVGVQRNEAPEREFVLLQNQGGMRINLRGHVVMSDTSVDSGNLACSAHVFADDALIPPGNYVILYSGHGESRWVRTKDGTNVYYTFMGRDTAVWEYTQGPMHVLSTHHTYVERGPALVLR